VENKAALNRLVVNDNWLFLHTNDYFWIRNGVTQRLRRNFKKLIIGDKDWIFSLINDIEKIDGQMGRGTILQVLGYWVIL